MEEAHALSRTLGTQPPTLKDRLPVLDDVSPELSGDPYAPASAGSVSNAPAVGASSGSAPQYRSRRELRDAEARDQSAAVPPIPAAPTGIAQRDGLDAPVAESGSWFDALTAVPADSSAVDPVAVASDRTTPDVPSRASGRREARSAKPTRTPKAARAPKAARPPKAALSASPAATPAVRPATAPGSRKNPVSVLATMAVVGGMFAVAGLPAYATQENVVTGDTTTASGSAQTLAVGADVTAAATARDGFKATTPEQLAEMNEDAIRASNNEAYLASGARAMGDDYPWPYELTDDQGGGLSPLNYYYRECVDFVAWRINRDQGYYAAPFKWVWSNLTPYGGNGGQWLYNWESLGRTVSNQPIPGAVAYTGGNHVAYVKSVNSDGTVTIEEYNYIPGMYGQRTIPASSVVAFLYPPS